MRLKTDNHRRFIYQGAGCLLAALMVTAGCGDRNRSGQFPKGFDSMSDTQKVAYVMEHATPDSVARFICLGALGRIAGVKIDTLANATLHAYETYTDTTLAQFSDEFDRFSASFPLPDRMKLLSMAGTIDPQGLGYDLGLHYVDQIRTKGMTVKEIRAELAEFRKACGSDTETYDRFMKGFRIALRLDRGKDLKEEIYREFAD